MMHTFISRWDHWWTRRGPPHALAALRIFLGVFLIGYALTYASHITLLFSDQGVVLPLYDIEPFSPSVTLALYTLLLLALTAFTIGLWFHVSTVLIILLSLFFWQLSLHNFPSSYNRILFFTLIVFAFSGADRTYSVAMKRKKGSFIAWEEISIFPQRLLSVQIAATYLGVGWQKVILPGWEGSEVLTYSMIGRWGTPLGFSFIRFNWPIEVWDFIVLTVKIFEFMWPFGLFMPSVRKWFFLGGALFHTLVTTFLGIWWFMVMIPTYILFFEPEEVQKFLQSKMPR